MSAISTSSQLSLQERCHHNLKKASFHHDFDRRNLVPTDKQLHYGEAVRSSYPTVTAQKTEKEEFRSYPGKNLAAFVVCDIVVFAASFNTLSEQNQSHSDTLRVWNIPNSNLNSAISTRVCT